MPIQLFQIFLDKQDEPYISGEVITGKFVVIVQNGYDHKGIYVKFEGHAMIKWLEQSSCFEDAVVKEKKARKQYFEIIFKYASEEHLSAGTHIFPFEYTLPEKLPSSFATKTTSVWYKMEALINKDPKPRREVILFQVQSKLDLNAWDGNLDLHNPISITKSKTLVGFFLPCCCNFHYVKIGLQLNKQGFIPEEKIQCTLAVFSETMPLTGVTLSFSQEITVTTNEKTMIEKRTMGKVKLGDILPEEGDDYRRWEQQIIVPKDILITSSTKEYHTVQIQTFLKFSVEANFFPYKVIHLSLPIVIGTVPLSSKKIESVEVEMHSPKAEIEPTQESISSCCKETLTGGLSGSPGLLKSELNSVPQITIIDVDIHNSKKYDGKERDNNKGNQLQSQDVQEELDEIEDLGVGKKFPRTKSTKDKKVFDSKSTSPEIKLAFGKRTGIDPGCI